LATDLLINNLLCSFVRVEFGHRRFLFDVVDSSLMRQGAISSKRAERNSATAGPRTTLFDKQITSGKYLMTSA